MNGAIEPPRSCSPSFFSSFAGFSFGVRALRERQFGDLLHCQLVSLPDSLSGCPRLCGVVPKSLRNYLENIQSMIKNKAALENMQPPPAAYCWDPVLKSNRAKRMRLFARLLEIGLLRPRSKETAKYFLGIFFVNKKDKKQKRLILDARIVNWAFVSPPRVSLCSSEGMARIEACFS